MKADIGIIGGSGIYHIEGLESSQEVEIDTPFGKPSDAVRLGTIAGKSVAFLPRHGRYHTFLPSEIPHRANIYALKKLGIRWLISLSAVGSLRQKYAPGHFFFPDQFFDRTKQSVNHTFFGEGIVTHISFGRPVCAYLQDILYRASKNVGAKCHRGGTYVNIEGPAFSTKAESEMHRKMGFDVVGMTTLAEAKLAREAEISYATISMVTDYDCWKDQDVTAEEVVHTLHQNSELACKSVLRAIELLDIHHASPCHKILHQAIMTQQNQWPPAQVEKLRPILARFL